MQISESRKKFLDHYALWEQSALSRMAYCKREGLKYTWFMSHQKEVRKQNKPKGFAQVKLPTAAKVIVAEIKFHYPDGRYFIFGTGTPVSMILELVK